MDNHVVKVMLALNIDLTKNYDINIFEGEEEVMYVRGGV